MVKMLQKQYPTIGICGLDCGLCPRYYTEGTSRCPGCCGADFFNKHPGCPFITCGVKKKNIEVCSLCNEFPCSKFDGWDASDSFISHKISNSNLNLIKQHEIENFFEQQTKRIKLLETMIKNFNDGRQKSFYCLATALLSISDLETSLNKARHTIRTEGINFDDVKVKAKILKGFLNDYANREGIELKLRKK